MSPRAASRLETLGFTQVYDYVGGKADWASFGWPIEGEHGSSTRVGAHVRTDVPVCSPHERMSDVRGRVRATGWETCIVTDERGVVLGRLGRSALGGEEDGTAGDAMALGPSTVRPALELDKALERMRSQNLTHLLVTRSDGVLIGVLAQPE